MKRIALMLLLVIALTGCSASEEKTVSSLPILTDIQIVEELPPTSKASEILQKTESETLSQSVEVLETQEPELTPIVTPAQKPAADNTPKPTPSPIPKPTVDNTPIPTVSSVPEPTETPAPLPSTEPTQTEAPAVEITYASSGYISKVLSGINACRDDEGVPLVSLVGNISDFAFQMALAEDVFHGSWSKMRYESVMASGSSNGYGHGITLAYHVSNIACDEDVTKVKIGACIRDGRYYIIVQAG